jgi:hypothetical protein
MRGFLYLELFLVVILGFVVSYKVAEKSIVNKKEIYTIIKRVESQPITKIEKKDKEEQFDLVTGLLFKQYGYVFVNNKKASLGDSLRVGDIIKTSSHSYAIIKFSNGAVLKVNPNSQLRVDNLEKNKDDTFKIHVMLGSALSHFSKKGKYKINTDTATVGVRGTTFYTEALSEKQTVICPCMGTVDFYDDKNHKKHIVSDHHQVLSLTSDGFVKDVKPLVADVLRQHNDDGIAELKSFVKRDEVVKESTFDYTYSKNSIELKKAIDLIDLKNGKKAIIILSKFAKKDPYASYLVGKVLYEGIGIKKDKKTAVKWLKISEKQEFPSAIEYLKGI